MTEKRSGGRDDRSGRPRRQDSRRQDSGRRDSGRRGQGPGAAGDRRRGGTDRRGPADGGRGAPRQGRQDQRPDRDRPQRAAGSDERPLSALEPQPGEPALPTDLDLRRLDRAVRAELRSLSKERADVVAGHLLLAGELVEADPESAYAHAEAARRRAPRLPIVREGAAETAYAAGRYDTALGEYRALRRMTGSTDVVPVMADCERALGRPQQALRLIREAAELPLALAVRVELRIVEAGTRRDLGQTAEAVRLLRAALADQPRGSARTPTDPTPVARLHYALADALLERGESAAGRTELERAADLDVDQVTDAAERLDEMDGLHVEFDDSDDPDDSEHAANATGTAAGTGTEAGGAQAPAVNGHRTAEGGRDAR